MAEMPKRWATVRIRGKRVPGIFSKPAPDLVPIESPEGRRRFAAAGAAAAVTFDEAIRPIEQQLIEASENEEIEEGEITTAEMARDALFALKSTRAAIRSGDAARAALAGARFGQRLAEVSFRQAELDRLAVIGDRKAAASGRAPDRAARLAAFERHRAAGLPVMRAMEAAAREFGVNWKQIARDRATR